MRPERGFEDADRRPSGVRRLVVALGLVVAAGSWSSGARAEEGAAAPADAPPRRMSDAAELERVVELYLSGQYDACLEQFAGLLDVSKPTAFTDAPTLERGRLYSASCAVLSGRLDAARGFLKAALDANPLMPTPDSLTFPPPLVGLFLEVREEVQQLILARERDQVERLRKQAERVRAEEEARALRERELIRLAEQEEVRVRASRVIASLPFGAGQFQNGNSTLGTVLLVAEGALAVTAATSAAVLLQLYSDELRQAYPPPLPSEDESGSSSESSSTSVPRGTFTSADAATFRSTFMVMSISTTAFGVLAALGLLEAHLAFQEERVVERRRRPLGGRFEPASPRVGTEAPSTGRAAAASPSAGTFFESFRPLVAADGSGFFVGGSFRF